MRFPVALKEWFAARWPIYEVSRLILDEDIPGGSSFFFSFGSAILTVFLIQVVTGIMQLFFYVPSIKDAYLSLGYFQTQVPFGWLIHGLHYWGAQVIIILMFLHLTRVFLWGAYKSSRELTWLAGVALLLVFMAFSLTGATLPWDQKGYWAGQVSTSVAGLVPFVGKIQKILLRGSQEMGQLTITRFFGIHVAVLPLAFAAFFTIHIVAMRRSGSAGAWQESKRTSTGPFWPDQVLKDAIVTIIVFFILLTLVVFLPYHFTGPADPFDTSFVPKPEWNFLFLYEALKFFQGPLEPLGAAGVPGLLILLLALVPFIDRSPERDPFKRPLVIISGMVLAAVIIALSVAGYLSPGYGTAPESGSAKAGSSRSSFWSLETPAQADEIRTPLPGLNKQQVTGALAADSRSSNTLLAYSAGPNDQGRSLSAGNDAAAGIANPNTSIGKPPLKDTGQAAYIIGNASRGEGFFADRCSGCHGEGGRKGLPNAGSVDGSVPTLDPLDSVLVSANPVAFAENIDRVIQHGSVPEGSPAIQMPAFGDNGSLNQQQIANLIAYVMHLNGVERAKLVNPGIRPGTFYLIAVSVLVLIALILAGAWSRISGSGNGEDRLRGGN